MQQVHLPITLAASLLWAFAPASAAPKTRDESPATAAEATLEQIDAWAGNVSNAAFRLNDMAMHQYAPASHLDGLDTVRGDINRIGRDLSILDGERDSLAEWEIKALDEILPLMKQAAIGAQNAIETFNMDQNRLWATKYVSDTAGISKDTRQVADILHDYLKLKKTQEKEQQIERSLDDVGQR